MKSFFDRMLDCHDKIKEERNRDAALRYVKVDAFVKSGAYSSYKKASTLSTMLLNHISSSQIAETLEISPATVRVLKKNLSDTLTGLFGVDFFDILLSDPNGIEVSECLYVMENFNAKQEHFVPGELRIISKMQSTGKKTDSMSFDDCQAEFDVLCRYSITSIKNDITYVDADKLLFLIKCIDGTEGSIRDRAKVLRGLNEYNS